jgi:hypothetical protein
MVSISRASRKKPQFSCSKPLSWLHLAPAMPGSRLGRRVSFRQQVHVPGPKCHAISSGSVGSDNSCPTPFGSCLSFILKSRVSVASLRPSVEPKISVPNSSPTSGSKTTFKRAGGEGARPHIAQDHLNTLLASPIYLQAAMKVVVLIPGGGPGGQTDGTCLRCQEQRSPRHPKQFSEIGGTPILYHNTPWRKFAAPALRLRNIIRGLARQRDDEIRLSNSLKKADQGTFPVRKI